jgi:DNA invertase Pin-like site-specific DNA recombinase
MNHPFKAGDIIASYFRDSGGDEQELSVTQQETFFLNWCQENNLKPGIMFKDLAKKGSSLVGREDFLRMIRHFRSGDAPEKGLVIWKYSRFSRDVDDAAFYRADLRRMGYIVHSLNDNIPEGPEGRFFEAAIDWMNQRFLEDLSSDVKRGLYHLVETYGCVPGTPPRGFKREPVTIGTRRDGSPHVAHKWIVDKKIAPTVRKAFKMRAAGATLLEVHKAARLYGSLNSYRTFFTNPIYIGTLEFGDMVIEKYCPPIVDMKTWNAVQVRIQEQSQKKFGERHPRRASSIYLLSGLIKCAKCGSPMNGNTVSRDTSRGRDEAYRCSRAKRRRDCDAPRIPRWIIEQEVLRVFSEYILLPESIEELQRITAEHASEGEQTRIERRSALTEERAALLRSITRLTEAISDAGHSDALLDALKQKELSLAQVRTELDQLATPVESVPHLTQPQIEAASKELIHVLNRAPSEQIRQLLRGIISEITVERDGNSIKGIITYHYPPPFDLAPTGTLLPIERSPVGALLHRQQFQFPFEIKIRS